ncbi:hypothetical protein [Streptomyces sp. NPDC051554]|uniref:hypothetical protein n=1 Tax=Streptomyces sp. NPDC051554 TaxID=3365656 RepID=UPI0037A33F33
MHAQGHSPLWNLNGFGNHDAGRARDSARLARKNFDVDHPIDLAWPLRTDGPALDLTACEMAAYLKSERVWFSWSEFADRAWSS